MSTGGDVMMPFMCPYLQDGEVQMCRLFRFRLGLFLTMVWDELSFVILGLELRGAGSFCWPEPLNPDLWRDGH